ncbi:hypothetical protein BJB45_01890 [Halomonas huangheensis]|uniref:Uncharacterized protein n=1 Tax=Halomonas huangheensis TaxID=1178482 RepID=W1N2V3_9GAMM|nr:hypothetical protein BJB45_01890 [Halomonas huangheensis]
MLVANGAFGRRWRSRALIDTDCSRRIGGYGSGAGRLFPLI